MAGVQQIDSFSVRILKRRENGDRARFAELIIDAVLRQSALWAIRPRKQTSNSGQARTKGRWQYAAGQLSRTAASQRLCVGGAAMNRRDGSRDGDAGGDSGVGCARAFLWKTGLRRFPAKRGGRARSRRREARNRRETRRAAAERVRAGWSGKGGRKHRNAMERRAMCSRESKQGKWSGWHAAARRGKGARKMESAYTRRRDTTVQPVKARARATSRSRYKRKEVREWAQTRKTNEKEA
eukprot:1626289-Pleurochrysis_carterae.AAC.3